MSDDRHIEAMLERMGGQLEAWKARAEINGKRAFELQAEIADLRAKLAARERVVEAAWEVTYGWTERPAGEFSGRISALEEELGRCCALDSGTPSDKGGA